MFDYESQWASEIQPQGQGFDYFDLAFHYYKALRAAGVNIDIISPNATNLSRFDLIFAPGVVTLTKAQQFQLGKSQAKIVLGPKTNAKTNEFGFPKNLAPDFAGLPLQIKNVETIRPSAHVPLANGGKILHWFEHLEGDCVTLEETESGLPAIVEKDNLIYCAGWLDDPSLTQFVARQMDAAGVAMEQMPEGLRRRETSHHVIYMNYSPEPHQSSWRDHHASGCLSAEKIATAEQFLAL